MNNTTNKKAIVGMFWSFSERIGVQLVTFIVSIILARLLKPEDFGTLALLLVVVNLLQVFIENGIGSALIQKNKVDAIDYSTALFFNIFLGIGLYTFIFLVAPFIADFYNNENMTAYVRVLTISIVISGVRNIQYSFVVRELKFKLFFFSTLSGTILGAIVGISLAFLGWGVWALVAQQLTTNLISTIVLTFTAKMDFVWSFEFSRLKEMVSFSWKILAAAFLNVLYNNTRQLAIGKVYSTTDLAYYNRGEAMPAMAVGSIASSIDSVLFSTMSKFQDDRHKIKNMTKRAIGLSSYVLWPIMVGMAVVAYPLITILLTDKWLGSVPFLQIFALAYAFFPVNTANLNAIKSLGYSGVFLKLEFIKKIVEFLVLLVTIPLGPMIMAGSILLLNIAGIFINSIPTKKLVDYGFFEQIKDIFPSAFKCVIMVVVIYPIRLLELTSIWTLTLQILLGVFVYVSLSVISRDQNFFYIFGSIKKTLTRKS